MSWHHTYLMLMTVFQNYCVMLLYFYPVKPIFVTMRQQKLKYRTEKSSVYNVQFARHCSRCLPAPLYRQIMLPACLCILHRSILIKMHKYLFYYYFCYIYCMSCKMDLTAIHQILFTTHYREDEWSNEVKEISALVPIILFCMICDTRCLSSCCSYLFKNGHSR